MLQRGGPCSLLLAKSAPRQVAGHTELRPGSSSIDVAGLLNHPAHPTTQKGIMKGAA